MEPAGRSPALGIRTQLLAQMRGYRALGSVAPAVVSFTAAQVAASAAYVVSSLLIARSLAAVQYGRAAFAFNIQLLLILGAGLGLTTAVISEIARARPDGTVPWHAVNTLLVVRIGSAMLVVVGAAAWAFVAQDPLPFLAGVAAALFIVQDFLVGILKGRFQTAPAVAITVAQPVAYLVLVIVLTMQTADAVVAASVAAFAFSLLPALAIVARTGPRWRSYRPAHISQLQGAWRIAGYGYVLTFLQAAYYVIPIVLLGLVGRYEDAAALSIMLTMVRLLPEVVASVLQATYFPRLRAAARASERDRLFKLFLGTVIALMVVPAVLLALYAEPALRFVFGGRYDHVAGFLPLATPLLVALPVDTLLTWTLLAVGVGGAAVVGQTARLAIVGTATIAYLGTTAVRFELLVAALLLGVTVSLAIQLVVFLTVRRRWVDDPVPEVPS